MKAISKPLVLGFVCFFVINSVFAKGPAVDQYKVTPIISNDLITLQTSQDLDVQRFELIISGPANYLSRQVINGNHVPFIEVYDADGNIMPDGQYTFELRVIPNISEDGKAAMNAMRESGDYSKLETLIADGVLPERIFAQSGAFRVHNGYIVVPETEKPALTIAKSTTGRPDNAKPGTPTGGQDAGGTVDQGEHDSDLPTRDQVIADDLIVQGSACVGMDCVNGESFGFDTLRLKENNLRIKFQDTSNSASFPSRDWQITANDSGNGGQNKFSIDDIDGGRTPFTIEAGAPSHSLYADDGGRVGLGTSTPVVELHVVDGDTPTLRLEQDGSSGFTAQTWDVASNETNFFVRDATNGSRLPFKIRPSAPTNSLFIDTDGDIGLGDATPDADLDLENGWMLITDTTLRGVGSNQATLKLEAALATASDNHILLDMESNGQASVLLGDTNAGVEWKIAMRGGNGTNSTFNISRDNAGLGGNFLSIGHTGTLTVLDSIISTNGDIRATNGDVIAQCGTVICASDRNLKENFTEIDPTEVLSKVLAMPVTSWNYKHDDDTLRHIGPVSQDFHAAFGVGQDDRSISVTDSAGVAFGAIQGLYQELQTKNSKISNLEAKLASQEAQLAAQEARLKALEAALLK